VTLDPQAVNQTTSGLYVLYYMVAWKLTPNSCPVDLTSQTMSAKPLTRTLNPQTVNHKSKPAHLHPELCTVKLEIVNDPTPCAMATFGFGAFWGYLPMRTGVHKS